MTDEDKISMTPDELAALVDSRIAERDAKREADTQRIRELMNPTPIPAPSVNAPDNLMAELTKTLDASGGDVDKATLKILARLNVDINGRPSDPTLRALFFEWEFVRDVLPELRAGIVGLVLANIKRRRERAKAAV